MFEPDLMEHAQIYGHNVWHYLMRTTIGEFHVVEVEGKQYELIRKIFDGDNISAEKQFKAFCQDLLKGKYL